MSDSAGNVFILCKVIRHDFEKSYFMVVVDRLVYVG